MQCNGHYHCASDGFKFVILKCGKGDVAATILAVITEGCLQIDAASYIKTQAFIPTRPI